MRPGRRTACKRMLASSTPAAYACGARLRHEAWNGVSMEMMLRGGPAWTDILLPSARGTGASASTIIIPRRPLEKWGGPSPRIYAKQMMFYLVLNRATP
jgi:hypothetical protein